MRPSECCSNKNLLRSPDLPPTARCSTVNTGQATLICRNVHTRRYTSHVRVQVTFRTGGEQEARAGELRAPKRTMFQARWRNGARNAHAGTPVTSGIPLNLHTSGRGPESEHRAMMSHEPHRKGGQEQVTNKMNGDTVGGGERKG